MSERATGFIERLLTLADLAHRWSCTPATVMEKVRTKRVPFIWLGPGEPRLRTAGQKFVRFRLEDIFAWEGANRFESVEAAAVQPLPATLGWDGKNRLKGRGKQRR